MGISERKKREREKRRNDILNAAEAVFFSKDIESATMEEVAAKAELSKGTLYLYFKNKEELLHGIVGRALEVLLKLFKERTKEGKTGLKKIDAIGKAYYDFYKEYPNYFSIMLHRELYKVYPEVQENPNLLICNQLGDEIFTFMQSLVLEGIADGSVRQDLEPFKLSVVLWGHTSGVLNLIRTKGVILDDKYGLSVEEFFSYSHKLMKMYLQHPDRAMEEKMKKEQNLTGESYEEK